MRSSAARRDSPAQGRRLKPEPARVSEDLREAFRPPGPSRSPSPLGAKAALPEHQCAKRKYEPTWHLPAPLCLFLLFICA